MCYRGGDEFWLSLAESGILPEPVKKFSPFPGTQKMFELS